MNTMAPQLDDLVMLLEDLPQQDLWSGDMGRVRGCHTTPSPAYEVEFRTAHTADHAVRATLTSDQIRIVPTETVDTMGEDYMLP